MSTFLMMYRTTTVHLQQFSIHLLLDYMTAEDITAF